MVLDVGATLWKNGFMRQGQRSRSVRGCCGSGRCGSGRCGSLVQVVPLLLAFPAKGEAGIGTLGLGGPDAAEAGGGEP